MRRYYLINGKRRAYARSYRTPDGAWVSEIELTREDISGTTLTIDPLEGPIIRAIIQEDLDDPNPAA